MASLEESLLASAIETLNIEDYWPTFDSNTEIEQDDKEYSIILYFYEELLNNLIRRYNINQDSLKAAIRHLTYNYGRCKDGKTPEELDYNNMTNCIGYLHRYAACHTALVHTVMVRLFHTCPPAVVRRMLVLKNKLNAVFLGSGPGNDLVGFLSALYGKHYGFLEMDITIVDKMEGWIKVFGELVRRLRNGDCGNASNVFREVKMVTSFVVADLNTPSSWSTEMKCKMQSTDAVILAKVVSVIPKSEKLTVLKNIVLSMKPGSLLIFLDCPYPEAEFSSLQKYLECVYEAHKDKFNFDFVVERFGYSNITASQAYIRVFLRTFVSE